MALSARQPASAAATGSRQASCRTARLVVRGRVSVQRAVQAQPQQLAAAASGPSTSGRAVHVVTRAASSESTDMARWEQQVRDGTVGNVSVKQAGVCDCV